MNINNIYNHTNVNSLNDSLRSICYPRGIRQPRGLAAEAVQNGLIGAKARSGEHQLFNKEILC